MKNIFKKIFVMLLGLSTLVSCNALVRFHTTFSYASEDELKTALSNATFYDDEAKTGLYMFEHKEEDKMALQPTKIDYSFKTYCDKKDKDTMTKDALKVKKDAFRLIETLTFKSADGKADQKYVLTTSVTHDQDIFEILNKNGKKHAIGIFKSNDKPYDDMPHNYLVSLNELSEDGKTVAHKYPLLLVSSDEGYDKTEEIAKKVIFSVQYVQFGK